MKNSSFLIDLTKCTGCRSCQVACKQWNELQSEDTANTGTYQNPGLLSDKTWTLIKFNEIEKQDSVHWFFTKVGCMHCEQPACASVCPVGAFTKTETGAVVYNGKVCIGCRYCMIACPFRIPTYEWKKAFPLVKKCTFCFDRQSESQVPACARACPTGAISFNTREEMIKKAKGLISKYPDRYNPHIYGEKEVGGTAVLLLAPITADFSELGFPKLSERPLPTWTWNALRFVPAQIVVVSAAMGFFYWLTKRKTKKKDASKEVRNDK
ncbi:MAG: 4Fe-4S dicluster domain-containing protein [Deltaproteobacteria bacterium]|nr:4Fe-4S dicluster domain-containing protein [Deltaproteobacteria bacterium]